MTDTKKLYPRTGDRQTIYLKNAITDPAVIVGDYTMYNDFVKDPVGFEKNNSVRFAGGVSAKPIRKRYSEETIAALLELKWELTGG